MPTVFGKESVSLIDAELESVSIVAEGEAEIDSSAVADSVAESGVTVSDAAEIVCSLEYDCDCDSEGFDGVEEAVAVSVKVLAGSEKETESDSREVDSDLVDRV